MKIKCKKIFEHSHVRSLKLLQPAKKQNVLLILQQKRYRVLENFASTTKKNRDVASKQFQEHRMGKAAGSIKPADDRLT